MSSTTESLRAVTSARGTLKTYGLDLPEPVEEALSLAMSLRREIPTSAPDVATYAREVLAASDRGKALASAAKRRAVDAAEQEIRHALTAEAARLALARLAEHSDEIVSAVFGSDPLAEALETLRTVAPRVPASTLFLPDYSTDGARIVADVALIRGASETIEGALLSLARNPGLGLSLEEGSSLSALAYARPDYSTVTRGEIDRALRGVRPGTHDGGSWQVNATRAGGGSFEPNSPRGVPAAILAGYGVPFVLVSSADEWESRVAEFHSTNLGAQSSAAWPTDDEPEADAA